MDGPLDGSVGYETQTGYQKATAQWEETDHQLARLVADRLHSEPRLNGYDIHVRVDGKQVLLEGVVDTPGDRNVAARIAHETAGVPVHNALLTSPVDMDRGQPRSYIRRL